MKASKELQTIIRAAIERLDNEKTRQAYRDGNFARAERTRDKDKRYRWDLLWASGSYVHCIPENLDDSHIDTMLRSIVPPLEKPLTIGYYKGETQ